MAPKKTNKSKAKPKTKKKTYRKTNQPMNLMKLNRSPISIRVPKTFRYDSYFTVTCPALQANNTVFWSMASLYRPDYSISGRNKSVLFFDEVMGNTNGLYQRFKPYSCTFTLKAINLTSGTFPKVVYSLTQDGTSVYPNTQSIFNIANRTGALAVDLEYLGDTSWNTKKFKAYHNQIWGITRDQYKNDAAYEGVYSQTAATGPWLAVSVGDGVTNAGSGNQMDVRFFIEIEYKCMVFDPVLKSSV